MRFKLSVTQWKLSIRCSLMRSVLLLGLTLSMLSATGFAQQGPDTFSLKFKRHVETFSAPEIHGASTRIALSVLFLGALILSSRGVAKRKESR
jgi:hypothetical protein